MAKKSAGQSTSPERGSPGRSPSKTSNAAGKSPRTRQVEAAAGQETRAPQSARPSSLLDTRVIYCGDNLEQLAKLPDACVDLIYIDPPFNSNRNYGPCRTGHHWGLPREITPRVTKCQCHRRISRGETKEKRACDSALRTPHSAIALAGSFYYHCDWHAIGLVEKLFINHHG